MNPLEIITELARKYKLAYEALHSETQSLIDELTLVKEEHFSKIYRQLKQVQKIKRQLITALDDNHQLFVKPKSLVLHEVRLGFKVSKEDYVFDDEVAVIEAIKDQFPPNAVQALVGSREYLRKSALADLTSEDLQAIGVEKVEASDEAFVRPEKTLDEKFINSLLQEMKKG